MKNPLLLFAVFVTSAAHASDIGGYLFMHMRTEDYGGMYYAVSEDGLEWEVLNDNQRTIPDYRGHPDVIQGHDGRYYMIGVEAETKRMVLWTSTDFIDWTQERDLPGEHFLKTPEHRSNVSWYGAPKLFYDENSGQYLISWHAPREDAYAKRVAGDAPAYWDSMRTFYTLTEDFESFTDPARLFEWEVPTIDVIVRKEGGFYFAIIKDEREPSAQWPTGKAIRISVSKSLTGPYAYPGDAITPGYREAPSVIRKRDGSGWYMYIEQYTGKDYYAIQAPTLFGPWTDVMFNVPPTPEGMRHGCVVELTAEELAGIREAFGE